MCLVHIYRPACGHFALLEPESQDDDAMIPCENAPCKRPTTEIADLLSRCAQCHAEATLAAAIPNMHKVDLTKFRRQKKNDVPKLDQLRSAGIDRRIAFNIISTRVWGRLTGENIPKLPSSRQRGRQSLEGFRYRRGGNGNYENPVFTGFYEML